MTAFLAVVKVTLRQLLGGKRLLAFGLLALLPSVVMFLSTRTASDRAVIERFHDAPLVIIFLIVLPVVSLILGASSLGDERRDGTLSFLILRPVPRWLIAAAKLAAAWMATTAIVGPAAVLAAGVVGIRAGDWSLLAPALFSASLSALAYVSVFLLLGYFTSRAVLLGLVYVFIWENGITFAAASLANVSLFRVGLSAYAGLVPESQPQLAEALGSVTPGAGGAAAKAIVIAVIAVFAAASLLRRRDLL
jgi:ABC-2 type transport system permease protein